MMSAHFWKSYHKAPFSLNGQPELMWSSITGNINKAASGSPAWVSGKEGLWGDWQAVNKPGVWGGHHLVLWKNSEVSIWNGGRLYAQSMHVNPDPVLGEVSDGNSTRVAETWTPPVLSRWISEGLVRGLKKEVSKYLKKACFPVMLWLLQYGDPTWTSPQDPAGFASDSPRTGWSSESYSNVVPLGLTCVFQFCF